MTDQTAEAGKISEEESVDTSVETEEESTEPEVVEEAATDDAVDDTTETPKPTRRDKRIDQLTGKNYALTEDRDYWRDKALAKSEPEKVEAPVEAPVAPKLADFDHDMEAYAEALGKYTQDSVDYAKSKAVAEIQETTAEASERKTQEELKEARLGAFTEKQSEFEKEHPDFAEIVGNPTLHITQKMTDVILELENGPAVVYELGLHPEIAHRIAQKNPVSVALELAKIEANLGKKSPSTKTSDAPDPPSTITGSRSSASKDPSEMTDTEFRKWRQKQIANRN